MLNYDETVLARIADEYGVDPELVQDLVEDANVFEFIPDDEERARFVESVIITSITGSSCFSSDDKEEIETGIAGRILHEGTPRNLGAIIENLAYDAYDHYITPNGEAAIARVRAKYED